MLSDKPWRGEAVLQFCAAQSACLCLGVMMGALLQKFGAGGFSRPAGFGNVLIGTLSFQGVAWVLIFLFLRQHGVHWCEVFGLRGPRLRRAVLLAVVFAVLIFPVMQLLQGVSAELLTRLGWPPVEQTAVTMLGNAKSWWTRAYLGVFAVVLAPVAEEFIFRGMLYPFVKQLGFPRLAWIGVNFVFAVIHFNAMTLLPLFALALALTWLYEQTDNLLAPITAHALFNAANLVMLFSLEHVPQSPP